VMANDLETDLKLVSVFKEASKNIILIFSCTRQVKNLKTNCSCTESIELIVLYIPSKKYSTGYTINLNPMLIADPKPCKRNYD
jgi:hypothetical protein